MCDFDAQATQLGLFTPKKNKISKWLSNMLTGSKEFSPRIGWFVSLHLIFVVFLGRLYALAPDEAGYLSTFNNLYGSSPETNPQYNSGRIAAPKIFLWIAYLPSKILNLVGVPDYLSIRILSIALSALTLYLLLDI
jgi:hypothetical protein